MHLKDLLDSLDLRLKLPQHWYSTDISDDFEEGKLIESGDIVVIEAENGDKIRRITNIAPTNKLKRIMNSITYPLATDFSISAVCLSILCWLAMKGCWNPIWLFNLIWSSVDIGPAKVFIWVFISPSLIYILN